MKYWITYKTIEEFKLKKKYISLDLGITQSKMKYHKDFVILPDGYEFKIPEIKENYIYLLDTIEDTFEPIIIEDMKLVEDKLPNLLISGEKFYKEFIAPKENFENKKVLDLECGLGYWSVYAKAKGAKRVDILNFIDICKYNPWSIPVFYLNILNKPSGKYDIVISYTHKLYSKEFLNEIYDLLVEGGKFIYYTPYKRLKRGIIRRMSEVGFRVFDKNYLLGVKN